MPRARRPSLLALVGGCVAILPFAPRISIEPNLALALFVAPAVLDTAFDLPPREMLRNWIPLLSLAVMLVLATTAAVARAGVATERLAARDRINSNAVWVTVVFVLRRLRAFINRRVTGAAVPTINVGVLVSCCGMRGLVTLATASALPAAFPGRNVIVLSAFTVVLGTLILQGFTRCLSSARG